MGGKNFHRHDAIKAGIAGAVNFSHTACAQLRLDFIGAEFRARRLASCVRAIIVSRQPLAAAATISGEWLATPRLSINGLRGDH